MMHTFAYIYGGGGGGGRGRGGRGCGGSTRNPFGSFLPTKELLVL